MASRDRIKKFVARYVESQENIYSTQEILDSGCIPRLEGYTVHPGKVSDSIYGGFGQYTDKESGEIRLFENPPLETRDGVPLRIMVRTEKISTHDINRGEIPFKDQILAENHNFMRKLVADDIGTSQFDLAPRESPHYDNAVVIAAENLAQIPLENVLRGYMAKSSTSTSLYQHFMNGKRSFCGHELPDNLVPNGVLPYVMDTPSTKSERDESVSPQELFDTGVCTPQQYGQIRNASLVSFLSLIHI